MKLNDEIKRLKDGPYSTERRLPPPDDYCAELLARGDRTGAIRHCKEMYNEGVRRNEPDYAERYLAFIDQVQFEPQPDDPSIGI